MSTTPSTARPLARWKSTTSCWVSFVNRSSADSGRPSSASSSSAASTAVARVAAAQGDRELLPREPADRAVRLDARSLLELLDAVLRRVVEEPALRRGVSVLVQQPLHRQHDRPGVADRRRRERQGGVGGPAERRRGRAVVVGAPRPGAGRRWRPRARARSATSTNGSSNVRHHGARPGGGLGVRAVRRSAARPACAAVGSWPNRNSWTSGSRTNSTGVAHSTRSTSL